MKYYILLFSTLLTFVSCTKQKEEPLSSENTKGEKHYGKTLYLNESDPVESLFPLHISDAVTARLSSQIYEGLLKLNPQTLEVENCLIESYTVDSLGTTYHFTLKDSIFFHNDACFADKSERLLTAEDVVFCFTQLCTYTPYNHGFYVFHDLVEGADEYYNLSKSGKHIDKTVSGISKIDARHLQIKLTHPSTVFKYILCEHQTHIYPKKYMLHSLDKDIKREVGTGPFTLSQVNKNGIILEKNTNYHQKDELGNTLPFLDKLSISFIEDKHTELDSFINLNTDIIHKLPADLLLNLHLHEDSSDFSHDVVEVPEMSLDYIGFNLESKIYRNKNLRKAIAYALDKKKILERALEGEADEIGNHGITPPLFKKTLGYNTDAINSIKFNIDSAQYFLKKSGIFTNSDIKNLTLHYNIEGHRNDAVVNIISRELKKNLGIDLLVKPLHQVAYNHAVESGEAEFFLSSWIYEYPHPMDHLAYFYSDGIDFSNNTLVYPDIFRYNSAEYNKYYKKAFDSSDEIASLKYLLKAEQILINDLPVIPLWYNEGYTAKQEYVKDYSINALQYKDFRKTYIKPHDVLTPE